ncbi:MAG: M48 family metallopeptidase [Thermoanaerobaculia bacterium]
MDFFENQEAARTKTRWLVFLFFLAVVFIVISVYIAVRLIFYGLETKFGGDTAAAWGLWSPELFLTVTVVTVAVVSLGSLYKIVSLSGGGETVAGLLGGRPLDPNTTRLEERRLLNVVEEMALASGMPTPTVFVLPKEMGINAFAAGFTPSDAVIGVTEGSLQQLSRDELQGVIGHEFSHILNGDMRLNLRLMGVIHGILVIALIGYWMLRSVRFTGGSGNRKSSGGGAIMLLALALLVIGWIGVFFGRLIKSAVSRQREFLADSAAVQFTRDPGGLAGALKKIGGFVAGSKLETPHAEEASHFYFSNGLRPAFLQMLATHPPLATRISRLEPGWDGVFADAKFAPGELPSTTPEVAMAGVSALAGAPAPAKPDPGGQPEAVDVSADTVSDSVGTLDQAHLDYARSLIAGLPSDLTTSAREPTGACALLYALLLDEDPEIRARQLENLRQSADPYIFEQTVALSPKVDSCPPEARVTLLDLSLPALRLLSKPQYEALYDSVRGLVTADEKITLFEYMLQRALRRHLESHFGTTRPAAVRYQSLTPVLRECAVLLSALARFGGREEMDQAFSAAVTELGAALEVLPPQETSLREIDRALRRLDSLAPLLKRNVIRACTASIAADRRITVEEGELLRAVADSLDCPVPPFLPGQTF